MNPTEPNTKNRFSAMNIYGFIVRTMRAVHMCFCCPCNELGGDDFIERQNKNAYQRRPVQQLERMATMSRSMSAPRYSGFSPQVNNL